jgi:hypothetical protein
MTLEGELRRCTFTDRKARAAAHTPGGPHCFDIPQADDPGFPNHRRHIPKQLAPAEIFNLMIHETAKIGGTLDIPVNVLITPAFHDYLIKIMESAILVVRNVPGLNLSEAFPMVGHERMSQELRECGHAVYDERIGTIRDDHRFVNIICDAGTVMTMKVVHAAVSNPSRLLRILPLEPYENTNWNAENYETFFHEVVASLSQEVEGSSVEICGVICDNLPAQVAGLRRFLSSDEGSRTGIQHVRCLNHMTNLVFIYAIRTKPFTEVVDGLPALVSILNTPESVAITGRRCPKLIRTRWVYLVDVLGFVMSRLPAVQTALHIAEERLPSESFGLVYLVMLPLALFSRAMEGRSRILGEAIPAAQEVLREWSVLKEFFGDRRDLRDLLEIVTAHFLARLRGNSFQVTLTAFALTFNGRAQIRQKERSIQTTGRIQPATLLPFVSEMQDAFTGGLEAFQHLTPSETLDVNPVLNEIDDADSTDPEAIPVFDLPDTRPSFFRKLQAEFETSLENRLERNLLDGILVHVQGPIHQVCQSLGYPAEEIMTSFHDWWADGTVRDEGQHPDAYWRQFHGCSDACGRFAHVALRFITLGCSEAEIERLLSEQRHLQGVHGTNYRTDTLQARELLRERR